MSKARFTIKLDGLKEAIGEIDQIEKKMENDVDALVAAAAYDTNDDAISNIQQKGAVDLGAGGGLISHQAVSDAGDRQYEVRNSAKWAPFVEWGTGRQVQVPDEWAAYARQYRGPYPGTWAQFEQNIKAWMKRHGIPDKTDEGHDLTYLIMVKILERGLPARPFLYPAYVKNKAKLIDDLKKLFK
jgi:HK97 gp10 family phage protein